MINKKPVICLFVATYKRLKLVDYVFSYYNQLKTELNDICDLKLICVGSDGKDGEVVAKKNGFEYYEYQNNPLSYKFNYACRKCKKHDPDALISIGSDDLISIEFFKEYVKLINEGVDFCGILDIFILTKGELGYWSGYPKNSKRYLEPIGPGKFFSRRLIEMLNWEPWAGKSVNSGLDGLANDNMSKLNYSKKILKCSEVNGFIIDIKTNVNITKPDKFNYDKIYGVDYIKKIGIEYDKIENLLYYKPKNTQTHQPGKYGFRKKIAPKPNPKIIKPKNNNPNISKKAIPTDTNKLYAPNNGNNRTQIIHDEINLGKIRKGRGFPPRHKKW